ncbi:MAG: hypothetical protein KatS3mg114_0622 [Planctomycetaceae bacterium]|nr:MAG: hypothetical protein KatS3mg114_0622 [Planctomycetaceae bacterium]
MEQLQVVLKYKFWILLGIGIILIFTGWWMATGSLAAVITERTTKLDGLEKLIPTNANSLPNNDWITNLSQVNEKQEKLVERARREMWERQRAVMFWPPTVQQFADKIAYRGEFDVVARTLYRDNYRFDVEKVWRLCRPYDPTDDSGIVIFPLQQFPQYRPGQNAPTSQQMWDWQEDLWILVPIMEAIKNLNGGDHGTRVDASIFRIERLYLLGGDRNKLTGGSGGGTAGGGLGGGGANMMFLEEGAGLAPGLAAGESAGAFGGMGGRGAGITPNKADFDPREEYGDGGGGGPIGGFGGGGGGFGSTSFTEPTEDGDMAPLATGVGLMGAGGAAVGPTVRRYVDDDERLPYKTRAFYLSVVMDHRKLPDFIAELTANGNSPWPILIGRVQMARINPDELMGPAGGRSPYGGQAPFGARNMTPMGPMGSGSYVGGSPSFSPMATSGAETAFAEPTTGFGGVGEPESEGGAGPASSLRPGANVGYETLLSDPNLARVALCGLIYIYKEVAPPQETATPAPTSEVTSPASETEPSEIPTTPAEAMPADDSATSPTPQNNEQNTSPTDAPSTSSDPAANPTPPDTNRDAAPSEPSNPEPAAPPN